MTRRRPMDVWRRVITEAIAVDEGLAKIRVVLDVDQLPGVYLDAIHDRVKTCSIPTGDGYLRTPTMVEAVEAELAFVMGGARRHRPPTR